MRDALTWSVIFGFAAMAVGLMWWMGAASNSGQPLATVAGIGMASLISAVVAALVAVKFSRRP